MSRREVENELSKLYVELRCLDSMDEETACNVYNVDFKDEAIDLIKDEIASLEKELRFLESYDHREVNYFRTADNPYLRW